MNTHFIHGGNISATGRSLMARNCNTFTGLGEKYIRVAVRKHEENQYLIKALTEISNAYISNPSRRNRSQ